MLLINTKMKKYIPILLILVSVKTGIAQDYRQTVKGTIIDKESHVPIEFATIYLANTTYNNGAISDENGNFKIENVPVGRITLQISFVGYKTVTIPNLDVTMGKELIVNIELVENVIKLDEVAIKAFDNKEKPINTYAKLCARTFSIEESHRYAGSGNDISRMAMNYAGVKMSVETTNEIVVRGNSPVGVLFRLDGVDIPNPSHFGDGGTTGGPIGMLNNKVLSNSDFITGAFPAEYGNAISAVFDLRMRNGNSEKHEFMGQAGLNGFEFGAEGPISKKNNSSYLFNYRYSTLEILRLAGMNVMGTAIVKYDDLSFKLNFPSQKIGNISIFGYGGRGYMKMFDSERDTTKEKQELAYKSDYEMDLLYNNNSGAIGLSHSYILGSSAYTKLILSATTIYNFNKMDSLSTINRNPIMQYYADFNRTKYAAKFYINKKFNSKNSFRTGISANFQFFNFLDSMYIRSVNDYRILRDYQGEEIITQLFIQHHHKFNDKLSLILGITNLTQPSNKNSSIEPRIALSWEFIPGHNFSAGYGLHTLAAPLEVTKQKVMDETGALSTPNLNLGFTKSHHFILGYDTKFLDKIHFKSEIYYQYLTDVIVEVVPSAYSLLNRQTYETVDVGALNNDGNGYNYGVEFTLEKFMDHGSYFLSTLSLFESKYRGSDNVLRNTAFNSHFVFNLLGGKEFTLNNKKESSRHIKKFTIDGKLNWGGGPRYSPVDLEASKTANKTIFDNSKAFSKQLPDYFRTDLRIGYKWIGKKSSQEIAIDIQNVTNRKNAYQIKFNPETGDIETYGMGMTPDLLYRIVF